MAFRQNIYNILDELQENVDNWTADYNENRPHSGKYCSATPARRGGADRFGRTPVQTFVDAIPLAKEKMLNLTLQTEKDLSAVAELSD